MPWRIHDHVLRGEIDNRVRGRVTGTIWLQGSDIPLSLALKGDCHPDLAGCVLRFENPAPVPLTTAPPAPLQKGDAGDITAARKVRVFDIPFEEAYALIKAGGKPPEHMANSLYLEWYSRLNGRVVVESADYRLEISEPVWRFTPEELAERNRRSAEDEDSFAERVEREDDEEPWDEFRAEQFLRNSDMVGEKYRRLLEKYHDHPDGERIIAHEMGWTWLEEELDARQRGERPEDDGDEETEDDEEVDDWGDCEETPPDPALEGIDWVHDDEERVIHPVAKRARDLLDPLMDEMKAAEDENRPGEEPFFEFVSEFMTVSVKLCAHLGFIAHPDRSGDPALVIAWLKRDLDLINKTLAALTALRGHPRFPADRHAFFQTELFSLRESVLEVIARLRKK
jgi:hypothetical protein